MNLDILKMINLTILRLNRLTSEVQNIMKNISRFEREKNVNKDRINQLEQLRIKENRYNYELVSLRRKVEILQKDIDKIMARKIYLQNEINILKKHYNIIVTCRKMKKLLNWINIFNGNLLLIISELFKFLRAHVLPLRMFKREITCALRSEKIRVSHKLFSWFQYFTLNIELELVVVMKVLHQLFF